ncbi:MAG: calcium-binding protein [Spirochaetaceae bacterium]|jgi:hypothetical protein|nr:calcium-binding protein [Spirochaetaceae bacterium]
MAGLTGKVKKDDKREERIMYEIIVDAHDEDEQAMGWYYYIEDCLQFPFDAKCTKKIATSPLELNENVTVIELADFDLCRHGISVIVQWQKKQLAVPLEQILPVNTTIEAIEDWHYWIERGYEL